LCASVVIALDVEKNRFSSIFKTSAITSQSPFTLSTEHLEVSFDGSTGLIQSVRTPGSSNREVRTTMDFTTYSSRSSGAYLFLPNGGAEVSRPKIWEFYGYIFNIRMPHMVI